ncbi:MAG: hypothetical protein R2824_09845 [Saprospiraceae bacterium]
MAGATNGGQLHGFIGSAQGLPSRFKILDLDHEVQIKSAGVIISTIDDIPDILDERKTYDVLLVFGGRPAVMVDFAPEIEAAGKQAFLKYYENYSTWGVRLVQEELPGTLHYLHAENGYCCFSVACRKGLLYLNL